MGGQVELLVKQGLRKVKKGCYCLLEQRKQKGLLEMSDCACWKAFGKGAGPVGGTAQRAV